MKPAFQMRGISKRFGPVQALDDVCFTLRPGTVHALVGENGAGKSTLMKILAGVYQPESGTIEVNGEEKVFENPHRAIQAGISMVYQELDLAEDITVAENIYLGSEPMGCFPFALDNRAMVENARELAAKHDFNIDPESVISSLPTGDCQIVEILKALARSASIIVMDEPTGSLSEGEAERLFKVIKDLRAKGLSMVYISHRLEEVVDLADDITVLRDGRTVHSYDPDTEFKIPDIVRHMVGREIDEFFPSRDVKTGETLLKVDGLSLDDKARDVSFEVRAGEIVGMAGLVGAGRTEVAETVFGARKKTAGTIELDGKPIDIKTPADAIANGLALLTEDRKRTGLCLELACSWNITLAGLDKIGMERIIKPDREDAIAAEFAEKLGVKWAGPQSRASSLSGGNQQKLLICRWLLAESRCLMFDEPTRGIDVGAKKEVYVLLNKLADEGKAILFISSELPELLGVTDRILVMRRGRLVGNLKTKDTSQEEIMHLAAVEEKDE